MFRQESFKAVRSFGEDSTLTSRPGTGDGTRSEQQMEQPFPNKLPTPPSSRPSSSRRPRCRSLRGNLRPHVTQRTSSQPELIQNHNDPDFHLRKYKLLPAIGSQDCTKIDTAENDIAMVENDIGMVAKERMMSGEALHLAVRLLDGTRHEHSFSSSCSFLDVVQFAQSVACSTDTVPTRCEFVTCDVPREVFSDLSVSLREANIKTRTLLYLRENEPDWMQASLWWEMFICQGAVEGWGGKDRGLPSLQHSGDTASLQYLVQNCFLELHWNKLFTTL